MKPVPTQRAAWLGRLGIVMLASVLLAGCSPSSDSSAVQANSTTTAANTAAGARGGCQINSASAPMPAAEKFGTVPADARITVTMTGIPSGTVKPGDPPAEVEVTLCNNSPVDYPAVGVTTVLTQCSCATSPTGLPRGHVDRFDAASGNWVPLKHPVITTGMDFLHGFTGVQPLPKGKAVTLKYRVALDPSMTEGKGSVESIAVVPDALVQIGKADLPFTALKDSTMQTPAPSNLPATSDTQSIVPLTGLTYPDGIAAAENGDVYLVDSGRVLKLAAGSTDQIVLPFTGMRSIRDVAVDSAGNVYATDTADNRVLKLASGANTPAALPFTGLDGPSQVAVDKDGNVYVTDQGNRVVRLAAGSGEQSVVPFTDLKWPGDVAVDGAGNVYVADPANHRILKLAAGSTEVSAISIGDVDAFTVDSAGDVYAADNGNRQVRKRVAGTDDTTTLPFTGLNGPTAVAVDGAGNVYIIDKSGFGRVVKLAVV